jgi:hypothetical protein
LISGAFSSFQFLPHWGAGDCNTPLGIGSGHGVRSIFIGVAREFNDRRLSLFRLGIAQFFQLANYFQPSGGALHKK